MPKQIDEMKNVSNRDDFILPDGSRWYKHNRHYFAAHAWAEFWIEGQGWVMFESTGTYNRGIYWELFETAFPGQYYLLTGYGKPSKGHWSGVAADYGNKQGIIEGLYLKKGVETIPASFFRIASGTGEDPSPSQISPAPEQNLPGQGILVFVNGKEVMFPDQKPFLSKENRTMVPVRFISEALGADVKWKDKEQEVHIELGAKKIELTLNNKQATVAGKNVALDAPPRSTNGRTMVPLRFVSEVMGAKVGYESRDSGGIVKIEFAQTD